MKKCLDCGCIINEKDGCYGRISQDNKLLGSVCNKCVFKTMSYSQKLELLKAIR